MQCEPPNSYPAPAYASKRTDNTDIVTLFILQRSTHSSNLTQQLGLQYELVFLVLLAALESLVIFPADRLLALLALYIAHNVASGSHVALARIAGCDVHDIVEEVGFAMLTAEIPADDVVVVGKMGFAVLAAVYFIGVEINIVCQPHFGGQLW